MNRADAIELDEGNLKSELFHAKQAFDRNSKIRVLLEVISITSQTDEIDLQKKASEKLSKLLDEI